LLSAAEQWLKLELTKNFKVIRDLELLPQLLGQDWSSVFLQRFDGTVTIWPKTRLWDWFRLLSDPNPVELQRMIRVGELVTWPKLHIIENRYRIEEQIMLGRQSVRRATRVRSNHTPTDIDGTINETNPSKSRALATSTNTDPLSMDTDTERAFLNNGTAWYFRRGRASANDALESGSSTPGDTGYTNTTDPLRSPALRRKWASDLLESRGSPDGDIPASRDHSPTTKRVGGSAQSTFLSRIGRKSVSALTLPFPSPLKTPRAAKSMEPSPDGHEPLRGISDSSSDEEVSPWGADLSPLVQDPQCDSDQGEPLEDDSD